MPVLYTIHFGFMGGLIYFDDAYLLINLFTGTSAIALLMIDFKFLVLDLSPLSILFYLDLLEH